MDVGDWLRDLGLGQYEAAFDENSVSMELLPHLTADDLKDLGVNAIGHRRLLLNAIEVLRGCAERSGTQDSHAGSFGLSDSAERRQVTVMFCDIAGSTALSTQLDPEDLGAVIRAYQASVRAVIASFGGFIAKYVGDGILIYFGWPEAHETDAETAVRAGLAVAAAISHTPIHGQTLRVRLGVATGLVVVGAQIGDGDARERAAFGETPNLAARLQGLAAPNTLVIDDRTRNQLGSLFNLEDLGPQALAGFATPQRGWRVIGEGTAAGRFEALRSETTRLIGRGEELQSLLHSWRQARVGEGRVVLILGEPGIGKSRLARALSDQILGDRHTTLRWFCSPYHQDSALYPTIMQLERAAGFGRDDNPEQKREKARSLLFTREAPDVFELLAELLSVPNRAAELDLSPQRRRALLFEALLAQLSGLTQASPVLAIFEDTHWLDSTSRELLDLMVERVRDLPVLLVITSRPEFRPEWHNQPHLVELLLNRLGASEVTALVLGIAGDTSLGGDIVAEIVERADGIPLFIEELTKAVMEQADRYEIEVPFTLHASLVARLDRLGRDARGIAQIGAVIGRDFSYELIVPLARLPQPVLFNALAKLSGAGLLACHGAPPHSSYRFKHALVQDAAYATLLRTGRRELHGRAVVALRQSFADLVERQPELLAHHLAASGDTKGAVYQWLKAGQYAASRLAHVEAIAHLRRGLDLLPSLPDNAERDALEIELQLALGLSFLTVKGMASPEMAGAYARAGDLAERRRRDHQHFQALFGSLLNAVVVGGIRIARPYVRRLAQVAEQADDDDLRLQAHHGAWSALWFAGEASNAHAHTKAGRHLYDPERHRMHRHIYGGHDPGVCAYVTGAMTEWLLGYPDTAQASVLEGLALAEQVAHPLSHEIALSYSTIVHLHRGEPELALRWLSAVEALRVEQRLSPIYQPLSVLGAIQLMQGATAEAIGNLRAGLGPNQPSAGLSRLYFLCLLAQALVQQREHVGALTALNEASAIIKDTGGNGWEPELHRVHGLLLITQGQIEEGQVRLEEALQVAQRQQAKSLELRAATSLARFWGERGSRAEGLDLLAPVCSWFTEGFDTVDLREAKALLQEMA